eukprot:UN08068
MQFTWNQLNIHVNIKERTNLILFCECIEYCNQIEKQIEKQMWEKSVINANSKCCWHM